MALIGLAVTAVVGLLASICVNINRFSLHALYRNRLTRCYLGASNEIETPTGSAVSTSATICASIRCGRRLPGKGENPLSLFHVVNIALNIVSTKRLAWQERKAESFTVSPLHCGAAYLGFRDSAIMAASPRRKATATQSKQGGLVARHRDGDFRRRCQPQYGLSFLAVDGAVADAV